MEVETSLSYRFSPCGGCTQAVVDALNAATKSVLVQAYSFTSVPIAAALAACHQRGLDVRIILDRSDLNERTSVLYTLAAFRPTLLIDSAHAIAHNKVMVIDSSLVITGSFNFTTNAEFHNAENLVFIPDVSLAAAYTANWLAHAAHSRPFLLPPHPPFVHPG